MELRLSAVVLLLSTVLFCIVKASEKENFSEIDINDAVDLGYVTERNASINDEVNPGIGTEEKEDVSAIIDAVDLGHAAERNASINDEVNPGIGTEEKNTKVDAIQDNDTNKENNATNATIDPRFVAQEDTTINPNNKNDDPIKDPTFTTQKTPDYNETSTENLSNVSRSTIAEDDKNVNELSTESSMEDYFPKPDTPIFSEEELKQSLPEIENVTIESPVLKETNPNNNETTEVQETTQSSKVSTISYNVIEVNITDLKSTAKEINEELKKNKRNLEQKFKDKVMNMEERLPHQVSLAFVFDATGSMHDDLAQLKDGADLILNAMLERDDNPIFNYILIPFRDPDVGPLIVTRDHTKIKEELSKIEIAGGVDCPEKSLTAIKMALDNSLPYSYIYVFTDASATDYLTVDSVLNSIQRKHCQIVFVLTGFCGDRNKPHYKVYEKIAEASSGQIFHLNKTDVYKVLEFVKESIDARRVNLDSFSNPPGYENNRQLPIDETLQQITISISGKDPLISVKDPSGQEHDGPPKVVPVLDLSEIKIINIINPDPGNWTITTGSKETHSVKVTGISDIKFDYGFSVDSTPRITETSYRPLQGTINNMLIWIDKSSDEIGKLNSVEILEPGGKLHFEVPLSEIIDENLESRLFKAEPFLPPSNMFLMALNGVDKNGNSFRRLGPTGIQPQLPEKPFITLDKNLKAPLHNSVVLKCRVESLVPISVWWFKNGIPVMEKQEKIQSGVIEYTILDLDENTEGKYDCKASNSAGHSMESLTVTAIGPPPKVTIFPEGEIIKSNMNFTVKCIVESETPISDFKMLFKYKHHGFNQIQFLEPLFRKGDGDESYYEYNFISSLDNEGTYICVATNREGRTEATGILKILPEIKVQVFPRILEFFSGEPLGLSCRIHGISDGDWFIKKEGWEPLPIENETLNWELTKIPMDDNGIQILIDIKNSTKEIEGDYICKAGQEQDQAVSKLMYVEKPSITAKNPHVQVEIGKTVILECDVTGTPKPEVLWTLPDDTQLSISNQNEAGIIVNEENQLIIHDASQIHEGMFRCEASNQYGTVSTTIRLSVWSKPELAEEISNQTIEIYDSRIFTCNFYGLPKPKVFWYFNDKIIKDDEILTHDNHTLILDAIELENQGKYSCVGKNAYGFDKHEFYVEVVGLEQPVLFHGNQTIIAQEGKLLEITCRYIEGKPSPFLFWQRNGINISDPSAFGINVNNVHYQSYESEEYTHPPNISLFFDNVLLQNDDTYSCIAVNPVGSDNYTFHLEVQSPPKIDKSTSRFSADEEYEYDYDHQIHLVSEPVDFISGDLATLDCGIIGKPSPLISWTKNGTIINHSKHLYIQNDTLIFDPINENDAGIYTCNASNAMGHVQRNFHINIFVKPMITNDDEENISKLSGQLVTLPCQTLGTPSPEIKWFFNGSFLNLSDTLQMDQTNTLRFIANVSKSGEYKCEAVNKIGNVSKIYNLDVYVPPTIFPPNDEIIRTSVGINLTLECEIFGFPQPSLVWKRNNENLINGSNDIQFDQSGKLTIFNILKKNAEEITCVAENKGGFAEKKFKIILNEPPKILKNNIPNKIHLISGEDELNIPCRATGDPEPQISWLKDGNYILNNLHSRVNFDGSLTLRFVTEEISGNYTCRANNSEGFEQIEYKINVIVPPTLIEMNEDSQSVILREGTSATLECPLKPSILSPNITWYKNNELFEDKLLNSTIMTLANVTRKDENNSFYTCHAFNQIGNVSWTFKISVHWPPKFIESDNSNKNNKTEIELLEGDPLELICQVDSNPPSDVQWLKNLEIVGDISQKYLIKHVKTHHSGEYICVASNPIGQIARKYNVQISAPPKFNNPETEQLKVRVGQSIKLDCRPTGFPKPQIEWDIKHTQDWTVMGNGEALKSFNVSKKSEGLYSCQATNKAGMSFKYFNITVLEPPTPPFVKAFVNGTQINYDKPDTFTIKTHENVTILCASSSNSSLMWIKNGIVFNNSLKSKAIYLKFPKLSLRDGGKYSCISRNKVGYEEIDVNLNVVESPKILDDDFLEYLSESTFKELDVLEGHSLNINCYADGFPFPDIYWMKGTSEINFNDVIKSTEDNQVLEIVRVSRTHEGNYTCIAKNIAGKIHRRFMVNVLVAPFVEQLRDSPGSVLLTSSKGQKIHLECPVNGNPTPLIRWIKYPFRDLTTESNKNILIKDGNQSLIIKNVSLSDNGNYTCVASNKIGITEMTYSIQVIDPPVIVDDAYYSEKMPFVHPDGVMRVHLKRAFILICNASGYPEPTFKWYKDNNYISKNERINLSLDGRYLNVMDVNLKDSGIYTCVIENKAGRKEKTYNVKIIIPGEWSLWTQWTPCSTSCGYGTSLRSRKCTFEDSTSLLNITEDNDVKLDNFFDKSACKGKNLETRPCFNMPCKINGGWSEWSDWTSCSNKCGKGIKRRYRSCSNPRPAFGGSQCSGNNSEQESCVGDRCAPWLSWSSWSPCSVSCGKGKMGRVRVCSSSEGNCNGPSREYAECTMPKCSVDGGWSEWSDWTPCSSSCGSGYKKRSRQCNSPVPVGDGKKCQGGNIQIEKCSISCIGNKKITNVNNLDEENALVNIHGNINGEKIKFDHMNLPVEYDKDGMKIISTSLNDLFSKKDDFLPHATFVISPMGSSEQSDNKLKSLFSNDDDDSRIKFSTGEQLKMNHKSRVDENGELVIDIDINGNIPLEINKNEKMEFSAPTFKCTRGYSFSMKTMKCEDINECLSSDNNCHSTQMCENTPGSYRCLCQNGYQSSGVGQRCLDINECLIDSDGCSHDCINIPGGYICICPQNYTLAPDAKTCFKAETQIVFKPTVPSKARHRKTHDDNDSGNILLTRISPKRRNDNKRRIPRPHKYKFDEYDQYDSHKYLSPVDEEFVDPSAKQRFLKHTDWRDSFVTDDSQEDVYGKVERKKGDAFDIFRDDCPAGNHFYGGKCKDIDECSTNMDSCDGLSNICVNIQGSYMCIPTPCPDQYIRSFNGSCEQKCDIQDSTCSERAALSQSLIYLSYSLSESDSKLPGNIYELNYGGFKTKTKYRLESQPQGETFEMITEENRGVIYTRTVPSLNHINRIVVKSHTYDETERKLLYFKKFIIYIYITE